MRHFRDFRDSFLRRGFVIYLSRSFLTVEGAALQPIPLCSAPCTGRARVGAPLGKRGPEIPEMPLGPEIPEMSTATMRGDRNAW